MLRNVHASLVLKLAITLVLSGCGPVALKDRSVPLSITESGIAAGQARTLNFAGSEFDVSCTGDTCDVATAPTVTKFGSSLDESELPPATVMLANGGRPNVVEGATQSASTALDVRNLSTSDSPNLDKTGLHVQSTGAWTGSESSNRGLVVEVEGAGNNHAALFRGGNVGIDTMNPRAKLEVAGGAIAQEGTPDMNGYLRTNATNHVDRSELNPGVLFFDAPGSYFGADLGFNPTSQRNRTRLFLPRHGDFSVAVARGLANQQSLFADQLVVRGDTGRTGIGTSAPTARLQVTEPVPGPEVFRAQSGISGPNYRLLQGETVTKDAVIGVVEKLALTPGRVTLVEARVVAQHKRGTNGEFDGAAYVLRGTYKRVASKVEQIGEVKLEYGSSEVPDWSATLVVSGTNVEVQIRGSAGQTVNWQCTAVVQDIGA